jgi:hypothetical protein
MKQPTLKGLTKPQIDYVKYLESIVNGVNTLTDELNLVCGVIALEIKDMRLEGSILSDDNKLEKILKLIDKKSKLEEPKKAGRPKKEFEEEIEVKRKTNIQDFVIK